MNIIYNVLEKYGNIEVFLRCTFERLNGIKKVALYFFNRDKNKNYNVTVKPGQWEKYKEQLSRLNINKGDILLVHSSIKGLGTLGVTARDIIDHLLEMVGGEGTLVFPTYPEEDDMVQEDGTFCYDPLKSVPWTGKLPRTFLEYPGVVRSDFPHNTLAAKGKLAYKMMEDNLKADFSQGDFTAWDFCVRNGMKILYLGVKASTSCTIVHYPEDKLGMLYPVKEWFDCETYKIQLDEKIVTKKIYIRKKSWFKYYKMFNTGYWLRNKGYLEEYDVDGVYIGFMGNVLNMCDELIARAKKKDLLFKVPLRSLK